MPNNQMGYDKSKQMGSDYARKKGSAKASYRASEHAHDDRMHSGTSMTTPNVNATELNSAKQRPGKVGSAQPAMGVPSKNPMNKGANPGGHKNSGMEHAMGSLADKLHPRG